MEIEIAEKIVAGVTPAQRDALEAAHWRYMAFAGIVLDDAFQEQAAADREAYPYLLKHDAAGQPVVSGDRAAEFMAIVTGFEREWCVAWDEWDFYQTHGVTTAQAAARGHA